MRYVVALVDHGEVLPEHLPPFIARPAGGNGQHGPTEAVERQRIAAALNRAAGNITAAARLLDISRSTLYRKMQQHALNRTPGR
jgi:transcriptional regulator of acetoin/glycerol metabolism